MAESIIDMAKRYEANRPGNQMLCDAITEICLQLQERASGLPVGSHDAVVAISCASAAISALLFAMGASQEELARLSNEKNMSALIVSICVKDRRNKLESN